MVKQNLSRRHRQASGVRTFSRGVRPARQASCAFCGSEHLVFCVPWRGGTEPPDRQGTPVWTSGRWLRPCPSCSGVLGGQTALPALSLLLRPSPPRSAVLVREMPRSPPWPSPHLHASLVTHAGPSSEALDEVYRVCLGAECSQFTEDQFKKALRVEAPMRNSM